MQLSNGDVDGGAASDVHVQGGCNPPQPRRSSLGSQSGTSLHSHSHSGSGVGESGYGVVSITPHGVSYSHSATGTSGYGSVSVPPHNMSPSHSSCGYGAVSVPTVGMAHTHPSSGYNAVSISTYNTSPSHTTRGYGGSPFHPKGQWCIPILVGSFLHGYGIPTAHIDTTVPPPPLISHNWNHSWHTSEVRTNAEPGPSRTPPPRGANYERHEIPRDASYHSNIHRESTGSRYTFRCVIVCVMSDSCATHPLSGNGTYRYSAFPSSCNFRLQQRQSCEPMREQNLNPSAI